MRHAPWSLLGAALAFMAAVPARASEGRVSARLSWHVDAEISDCMSRAEFSDLAAERMGRPLFRDDGPVDAIVEVRVTRVESRLAGVVRLRDRDGQLIGRRELLGEGPSCRDLVDHTILVVGLMLDFVAAPPQRRTEPVRIRVPETPNQSPWRVRFGPAGEFGTGLLPRTSPGAGLDISVITPLTWGFEVSAFMFLNSPIPDTDQTLSARALRLAICPLAFEPSWIRAELCVAQQTALLQSEGQAFPPGRTQEQLSVALGPRLRLDAAPWRPAFLALIAGGEVALSQVTFNEISPAGAPTPVYETAPFFAYAAAIVGVEVP